MAFGLAMLAPQLWGLRVDWDAAVVALERRLVYGARVEEGAIQRHVDRARAGESEALGELFQEFRPDVVRLCARLLGRADAEDAANEAFLRAQHRLESYDRTQSFRPWLLSIAAHHCVDQLRRRSLEKRLFDPGESDVDDLPGNAGSVLDGIVRSQQQAAVQTALDRLPDRHRAPLVLRYFAELSYDAIGEELDLTRSQVATLLFRAKRGLRELLRAEQETGP